MAAEWSLHAKENRLGRNPSGEDKVDFVFLGLLLLLLGVGLLMLYSASYAQSEYDTGYAISTRYLQKQGVCAILGLIVMWIASRIPTQLWRQLAWPLYFGSILLLLSVLAFGSSVNGAKRWITIAGLQFQPSEVAKFTMILTLARLTTIYGGRAREFRYGVMGFGCTTSAVMAARTMENEDDRRMTIMLTPFMSCAAKLPVFALVADALYDKHEGLVVISLYLLGIMMGAVAGRLLKATVFEGSSADFVLELPPYRMPRLREVLRNMWQRASDFVIRAGTVILIMSTAIWLMQYFTPAMSVAQSADESILAALGSMIAPFFRPLGFGDWRLAVALLTGLAAKEAVVSTLRVLYGAGADAALLENALGAVLSPLAGYSFLVFTLLYMPCISAFAVMKRELGGWRWAVGAAVFQTALAYFAALMIFQIGSILI